MPAMVRAISPGRQALVRGARALVSEEHEMISVGYERRRNDHRRRITKYMGARSVRNE